MPSCSYLNMSINASARSCKNLRAWLNNCHVELLLDRDPVVRFCRWTAPGATWGRGCLTLAGDAAHPMTPNLGQGGCCALEARPETRGLGATTLSLLRTLE